MYMYYIRDDATGLYLIGRMKLGAPVPTCVWGERRADALTGQAPNERTTGKCGIIISTQKEAAEWDAGVSSVARRRSRR